MPANECQKLSVTIEDLQHVQHGIGYPDVAIAVDCDALGVRKASRPIAMLAELADEFAVGIENLDAVV